MLFWNHWNQESAGHVYFFLGKNLLTCQTRCTFNLSRANLNGPIRNTFIVFCWNQSETILLQGSPELLISPLYMRRRALGWDWDLARSLLREWLTKGVLGNSTCHQLPSHEKLFSPLEWNYVTIESLHFLIKVKVTGRGWASKWWWWWCWWNWVEFVVQFSLYQVCWAKCARKVKCPCMWQMAQRRGKELKIWGYSQTQGEF